MSTIVRLRRGDIEWMVSVGPWPFVCNVDEIHWPEHSDEEVIDVHARHPSPASKRIVRRLREAATATLQDDLVTQLDQPEQKEHTEMETDVTVAKQASSGRLSSKRS